MVVLGANGPGRRTAMLRLAQLFADGRADPNGRGDRTLDLF
jgi:hypothetical protein